MSKNNTIKKQGCPFTQIPNKLLEDKTISLKAKGLYAFMFSKPDGWSYHAKGLKKQLREGDEAIASGLAELMEAGWITRHEKREVGRFAGYEYFFRTSINDDNHRSGVFRNGQTVNGNSATEKPDHSNTIRSNTKEEKPEASKLSPSFSAFDLEISELLYMHLQSIFQGIKQPDFNKWAEHVRKMRELDDRPEELIRKLIDYVFEDKYQKYFDVTFWRQNIRSTEALRRHYDTIALQINTALKKVS